MSNVFNLKDYRNKDFNFDAYTDRVRLMHKADLLYELSLFSDELFDQGYTKILKKKGIILYSQILPICETEELKEVCKKMLLQLGAP